MKREDWRVTHGMSESLTYSSWKKMKDRCSNPKYKYYDRYGGRGIKVCDRWLSFEHFYADMGERPAGTSIDRIDNNGNYEPGNCRWVTRHVQNRNKSNSRLMTHNGETLCVSDWADRTGICKATISSRLDVGYSPEEALSKIHFHKAAAKRKLFAYKGGFMSMAEAAESLGISYAAMASRLRKFTFDEAMSMAKGHSTKRISTTNGVES